MLLFAVAIQLTVSFGESCGSGVHWLNTLDTETDISDDFSLSPSPLLSKHDPVRAELELIRRLAQRAVAAAPRSTARKNQTKTSGTSQVTSKHIASFRTSSRQDGETVSRQQSSLNPNEKRGQWRYGKPQKCFLTRFLPGRVTQSRRRALSTSVPGLTPDSGK